jgi:hypothetical protein
MRRLVAVGVLLAVGCQEKTYPVQGVVKFRDGQPAWELAQGAVVFETPDRQFGSRGDIDKDGRFRLDTLDLRPGALKRKYLVAVAPPPDNEAKGRRTVAAKYTKPATSGIEVEVQPGPNDIEIVVDAAPRAR